ncbi:L,D-transpeptidase family protein [Lutibacter sp. B2]|nr:L,D-transpeptidase family protein [Lutibacter sp. B2]
MLYKLKTFICFSLVFILTLLQVQVLSSTEIYAQNKESLTINESEKVEIDNLKEKIKEELKVTDKVYPMINSITFDKSNIEIIGTVFTFTAISKRENLSYKWIIFKDLNEIHKKEYSKENFLDFTMNESGKYQAVVTVKDENGMIINKLSEAINIILPIKINSVDIDKKGKQLINTPLTFSVSAQGDHLMYRWSIFKDSNIVYDGLLSENNSINYTPHEPGVYKGIVYVTDEFGKSISKYSDEVIISEKIVPEKEQIISSDKETLEASINTQEFNSKTNHYIWIDTTKNLTYIFKGENKNWNLTKTMVCTDGKASTPTIKGNFTIQGRAPWLTSYNGKVKAKYKVNFFGHYYFHSILFDSKGKKVVDSRLGKSLSHGCVRLSVDNAKWIYDNIKNGTGLYIY